MVRSSLSRVFKCLVTFRFHGFGCAVAIVYGSTISILLMGVFGVSVVDIYQLYSRPYRTMSTHPDGNTLGLTKHTPPDVAEVIVYT